MRDCKNGGIEMNYQRPKIEIIYFEQGDVVTLSGTGEGSGDDVPGENLF